ncbi:MAG: hypothetical protein AAF847_12045 [Bacteroidota bacterium]
MEKKKYIPINCSFYDILEVTATLKKACIIRFYDTEEASTETRSKIVNLYTKKQEEYMELDNGLVIRLDRIISVDGELMPNLC